MYFEQSPKKLALIALKQPNERRNNEECTSVNQLELDFLGIFVNVYHLTLLLRISAGTGKNYNFFSVLNTGKCSGARALVQ